MLKSMTGYGQGSASGSNFTVTVDLRSVNNRNLDIHWRAPQDLASLEIPLKKQIQAAVTRGRVDVNVNLAQTSDAVFEINRPLIRGYLDALRTIRNEFALTGEPDLASIVRLPNVLTSPARNSPNEAIARCIEEAITQALAALVAMRDGERHQLH